MFLNSTQPLDEVVLAGIPTLNADHAWSGVSNKYAFLSTAKVIEALGSEGIKPYSVKTSYTRMEDKRGYTKHMLRFRHDGQKVIVGGVHHEIVVTNAHDTGSAFILESGLWRGICANGLVVSAGVLQSYRMRHVGVTIEQVLEAVSSIIEQFPQVEDSVRRMQSVQLTDSQREHMASLAMGLRWDADKVPFESARLLSTRRVQDIGSDLWTTYNVIQENLIQGQTARSLSRYRGTRGSRAIKSIDSDLKINRELWALAEQYATA